MNKEKKGSLEKLLKKVANEWDFQIYNLNLKTIVLNLEYKNNKKYQNDSFFSFLNFEVINYCKR